MSHNTPRDLIEVLADLWPQCFAVYEARRRPLKLGIHHDIADATDGAITPAEITTALRAYVANRGYLRSCRVGADRINLNGDRAGIVTVAEATNCRFRLEAQQARRAAKANGNGHQQTDSSAPPSPPKRLGLADLREAWRERQRQAEMRP